MATNPLFVCHFDGPPGSSTFTDVSGNGHNVAPYSVQGGVGTISSNAYFGSGSLNCTTGGNYDGLAIDPSPDFYFPSGSPFTFDFWVNWNSTAGNICMLGMGTNIINWITGGGLNLYFSDQPGTHFFHIDFTPVTGTWYHVAWQRDSSNNVTGFLNGVPSASGSGVSTQNIGTATASVGIGNSVFPTAGSPFNGYIDELRISNTAIFPVGGFTPPTLPWPLVYSWPTQTQWNVS
jgi:hypothetical protein